MTMPVAHSVKPPEKLYLQTQLSRPSDQVADFEDVQERVRTFSKESLVAMGARILWALWKDPDRYAPEGPERAFAQLVWAHAPGMIGMACIYAPDTLGRDANSSDFALLAYELFLCPGGSHFLHDATELVRAKDVHAELVGRTGLSRLKKIPDADTRLLLTASFMARLARGQRPGHVVDALSHDVRAAAVYARMKQLARDDGQPTEVALERAERAVLRTDFANYLRALMALRGYAEDTAGDPIHSTNCPGVMEFAREGALGSEWGTTRWADLLVVADRLARAPNEYAGLRAQIGARPKWQRAFCEEVWSLQLKPMIRLPNSDPARITFMVPSPWLLRGVVERELLYDVPAAADGPARETLMKLRGDAFQAYLRESIGPRAGVVDIDALPGLKKLRHPDFAWVGGQYGIIVEAKITMSPVNDLAHRELISIGLAWGVGCSAVDQGTAFLNAKRREVPGPSERTWLIVIVTMEPGAADATQFLAAAKRWGFLDGSPFAGAHVANVAELEHFMLEGTADTYGAILEQRWASLVPDFMSTDNALAFHERQVTPPVGHAWDVLLSPETNPWRE